MDSKLVMICAVLACTSGCAVMERHPTATKLIAGSLFLSAGYVVTRDRDAAADRHIDTPTVNCASGSCK